jgi:protein phosphatase
VTPIVVVLVVFLVLGAAIAFALLSKTRSTEPSATRPTDEDLRKASRNSLVSDEELEDEDYESEDRHATVTGVGLTDVGLRRKLNEDAFVCMPEHDLYAIADGMGAHAAGEVASKLTLEAITDAFERNKFLDPEAPDRPANRKKRLVQVIERANQIVLTMSKEVEGYRGMGTTVVMAHFSARKDFVFIAHVGDSRCYRIRGEEISQLTVDHTLGNVGIMGKTSSLLSRAVGIEPNIDVDVCVHRTDIGDVFLLCSDGLSRMVSDEEIRATVESEPDLNEASKKLINQAKSAGGRDNVTTVLIRVEREADNPPR